MSNRKIEYCKIHGEVDLVQLTQATYCCPHCLAGRATVSGKERHTVTVGQTLPKPKLSVFLAGPIERRKDDQKPTLPQWRKEAVKWLELYTKDLNHFLVLSPEWGERPENWSYEKQVDWEIEALQLSTCILCWIPRQLPLLPAFTTNIEVGEWLHSPKLIVGAPPDTPHTRYIQYRRKKLGLSWCTSLESCAIEATRFLRKVEENE